MSDGTRGEAIRILLLEDNALDAELIEAQLTLAGLKVGVERVWTLQTFLGALEAANHDVILSDHQLPGFDGDEALALAALHAPHVPFIFVSGTLTEELAVQALTRGARDYVVKQRLQRLPDAIVRSLRENEERKKLAEAEAELRASRERLELIANALPALIAHIDADHRYRFGNDAHTHWFGLTPDQLVGAHAATVLGERWLIDGQPFLDKVLRGGKVTFQAELPGAGDGPGRYAQIDCVAELAADGTVTGYYMLARDISELKQRELTLRESNGLLERQVHARTAELKGSESRLEAIFESSFQHQVLLSPDGRIIDANIASLAAVLLQKQQVLGQLLHESAWFDTTDGVGDIVREAVADAGRGVSSRHELELHLPTGVRCFDYSFRPLLDHRRDITAIVSEAVETTARREAEHALRQAQKIEAIGQLTGGIAHDFNNILTIIAGNVELVKTLMDRPGSAERSVRALDSALKGVSSAARLTHRLLAFARRQPLKTQPIDSHQQMLGMQDMLRRSLGELVQLQLVSSPGVWSIEADPAQLEASVLNLAVNARDAMPSGGRLTIEVSNTHLDANHAGRLPDLKAGEYVMLRIRDTGEGMTEETMARVFEPFFTTKEVGRGTGLGLPMVYGFVRQSGGHVLLESSVGVGTTITMFFPRSSQPLPTAQDDSSAQQAAESHEATILVAEDNDDVRAYVVEVLREMGYRVLEAHDGYSALRLLQRPDVTVDMLFSDVVMPGMAGWELAQRATQVKPGLQVLFTSGYPRNLESAEGGVRDVAILPKPYTRADLAEAVAATLLRARQAANP